MTHAATDAELRHLRAKHAGDAKTIAQLTALLRKDRPVQYEISKGFAFEAAHSLPHLPPDHKCHRTHGHSYRFTVTCGGQLGEHGFVAGIDYSDLSRVVRAQVVDVLDHQNINDFMEPSTAENLAAWIWKNLESHLPLVRIDVHETATTCVTLKR